MEGYIYCPFCKETLKEDPLKYSCGVCGKLIYKHPSLAAATIPVKDGKILMGRRNDEPAKGKYDFIGGFAHYGETPSEAARRETKEETGADCIIKQLIGVYIGSYEYQGIPFKTIIHVFAVDLVGTTSAADDMATLEWLPLTHLPTDLAFPEYMNDAIEDLIKAENP